jgi:hypothetical protein
MYRRRYAAMGRPTGLGIATTTLIRSTTEVFKPSLLFGSELLWTGSTNPN